ncbi:MAG: response regulator transcription factor [Chloroflexota bacterium]|nr:response regulator transcription factor [Chloroflexota bacterium]
MIRILLVDDHRLLRQGTRALLAEADDIQIVAEAEQGEEALTLARKLRPDVILLDIRLKGTLNGVEVARAVRQDLPEIKVVILTAYDYEQYVRGLFAIGVHGYLLKDASGAQLISAMRKVCAGEQVLSPEIEARNRQPRTAATDRLSDRELEVLALVERGGSNGEIGKQLGIKLRTVESHLSNVMAKLGARSRTEAICVARQRRIMGDGSDQMGTQPD